jgi:hypothetical protein
MSTKTLLWLDDERNPFNGNWVAIYAPGYVEGNIVWVKNYDDFVEWIENNSLPAMICFDHDLGGDKTGYDAAKYVVNYCFDHGVSIPRYNIQSANPVGVKNINQLIQGAIKHI